MRSSLGVLMAVFMIVLISGCKTGIQVQDNTYDALGGQVIKVSEDFVYIGACDPTFLITEGQGRAQKSSGVKTRGDIFVREEGGNIYEVFVIQRAMLTRTGHYWSRTTGVPMKYEGTSYKESFFDAKIAENPTVESYITFLRQNGYKIDVPDLYVRRMSRIVGNQVMADIFYGVYPGLIPEGQRGNHAREEQFIRERFDTNISVVK